ncbi:tetratricopeptide repeat protein [Sphingomonas oligophenolica]|uniref:Tetratricopeptide repeat protein n=2 Tax=Sphingomonas oligophenolica TaxID=301154 RepID=A0A502CLR8_9SPHN|nr:tetratricopeptide repeat protein [Sphingomonas oligophenolica]
MLAGVVMALSMPAVAQEHTSYQLLARGHYSMVIDRLEQQRKADPARPEMALNLAAAYAQTGRIAEARALYTEVLAEPAVDLDMLAGTTATSHQVAQRGLSMLGRTIATR